MNKQEAILKAEKIVEKIHNQYHSNTGKVAYVYGEAYKACVLIKELIKNIDDLENEGELKMKTTATINGITAEIELTAEQAKVFEKPKRIWYFDDDGNLSTVTLKDMGEKVINHMIRHCFAAYSEAECLERKKKADMIAEYEEYAEKCNGCKQSELDWDNTDEVRHYAYFDYCNKIIDINGSWTTRTQGAIYFKNTDDVMKFINLKGEPAFKKYILGVEE